jgi:metal-sulfur cluster biosynthetic enzyme
MQDDAATDPRLDAIWQALRHVIDPELGLDVVTLGLVYDVRLAGDTARITHTLTTRGCPMQGIIQQGIRDAMAFVRGVGAVELALVWDPEWHPGMIDRAAWAG